MRCMFIHIPKTGGTSVGHALCRHFPVSQHFGWGSLKLDLWPHEQLAPYNCFVGHFHVNDLHYLGHGTTAFTMVRRPADRLQSLFHYWRRESMKPISKGVSSLARAVVGMDYIEFLTTSRPSLRGAIDNAMVKTFLPYPLRGRNGELSCDPGILVADAMEAVAQLNAVGVFERFDESVAHIGAEINCSLQLPSIKMRAREVADIDEAKYYDVDRIDEALHDLTVIDELFYKECVSLFERQLAEKASKDISTVIATAVPAPIFIHFSHWFYVDDILGDGWDGQEGWGIWSIARLSSIVLQLSRRDGLKHHLSVEFRPAVFPTDTTQVITVYGNGEIVGVWTVEYDPAVAKVSRDLVFNSKLIADDGKLVLSFEVNRLINTQELIGTSDNRPLGIGLETVCVRTSLSDSV